MTPIYRGISIWQGEKFSFVVDIDEEWSDTEIWKYAQVNDCTIVTKDADFSHRIIISQPPPKVIHFRIGNLRLRLLNEFINKNWNLIKTISRHSKLVNVYLDRIESIK